MAPEEDESKPAYVFIEPNDQPARLDKKQLAEVQKILPSVQFIDSHALLASEIPMAYLIAACGDAAFNNISFLNRKAVEEAAREIRKLPALSEVQPVGKQVILQIEEIKKRVVELAAKPPDQNTLEMHLFKEILDISLDIRGLLAHHLAAQLATVRNAGDLGVEVQEDLEVRQGVLLVELILQQDHFNHQ